MFHAFCHKQNLQILIKQLWAANCEQNIQSVVEDYIRSFQSDSRGTLTGDLLAFRDDDPCPVDTDRLEGRDLEELPVEVAQDVKAWFAVNAPLLHEGTQINPYIVPLGKLQDRGATYRPMNASDGDSNVIFTLNGGHKWRAGRVSRIFCYYKHVREGVKIMQNFLLVKEYARLKGSHAILDPYRKFPIAGGRLFYEEFRPTIRLLTVSDISCQYALTPRQLPKTSISCVHVLPLDKVRMLIMLLGCLIDTSQW